MEDMRPGLRHGDLTTTGGVVIATGRMRFHGKEVAAEGDLATCPACKSVGHLINDAYPAFGLPGGRQLAIQGAWIFCKCANPPRAIASTDKFRVAVNRAGSGMHVSVTAKSAFTAPLGGHNRAPLPSSSLKETDQKSTLEDDPQLICPNMSNAEFAQMVMQRRDKAVSLIDKRLTELAGWSTAARVRVAQWFGNSDGVTRDYLAGGLARIRHVLAGLTPIRNTLAAFLLLSARVTYACMPGQNFDVYFSSDSAAVSSSEILRLANWMVDQRIKYPTQEVFQVDGRAEDHERNARALAKARLRAVVSILKTQHFNQVPVDEHSGVYRSDDVGNGRRVEISILPACPNPCCSDGDMPTKR